VAVDVFTEIEISRPREEVAAFAAVSYLDAMRRANEADLRRLKGLLKSG
jgi:hypothetical protein